MEIENLNKTVKCKIAPSSIHGVGVFAIREIKKGEKLYCVEEKKKWLTIPYSRFNELLPEVRELIEQRYPRVKIGSKFLSPNSDVRLMSFMNHSELPNYDIKTDTALVDIPQDTEVLEDYKDL